MTRVDNPKPEDLKIALYGWTGSAWIELKTNIYGVLEIAQPIAGDLKVGLYGWDGSGWRRLRADAAGHPQVDVLTMPTTEITAPGGDRVFNIETPIMNRKQILSADEGQNILYADSVPTGKVWILTFIGMVNLTGVCSRMGCAIHRPGVDAAIINFLLPIYGEYAYMDGVAYLGEEEYIFAYFYDVTAGSTLELHYNGYQMDAPT